MPSRKIATKKELVYEYTTKGNMVAVVTDGTAVLGLGDIGPFAALPVMEGKAILFKKFANVDAFPICLNTKNVDEIVQVIKIIAPSFGGINLEDISGPRCFEIEERLKKELDIPVFHDDQHGTAVVVLAGLINSLKLVKKRKENVSCVINGAGAAGIAITKLLLRYGFRNLSLLDTNGLIYSGRKTGMNSVKNEIAKMTNREKKKGSLQEALKGADIFIGVSKPNIVTAQMIRSMEQKPIVFALSNPDPEILPKDAKKGGAYIIATGRSDYPNQVNNVLAFPGIFRGVLDARARQITDEMKIAAAEAIASSIKKPLKNRILPSALDKKIAIRVARVVKNVTR